ncbi:MAG: glycoside hydrolase family 2 protein, partial [Candidatus Brocadiae bacterium]|nr:glycoside hydrolase family 2 protein [Candidatus Brocadiia bacterium]
MSENESKMQMDLTGAWTVRQAESTDASAELDGPGEWLEATVPGCIHLDLMRAGRLPDPFYGFNDLDVQWVADANWLYRRTFHCPAALCRMKRIELVCHGLDTFAEVSLNGKQVGRADNMFLRWRWDVTGLIQEEGNELLVLFESPKKVGQALLEEHGRLPIRDAESPQRMYTRKAQYASGWDWAPDLNTSGIWRPILLEGYANGRLSDVCARIDWQDPHVPVVNVAVEVEALEACSAEISAELVGPDFKGNASASADLKPGANTLQMDISVANPQLWWPAGFGAQSLYELTVTGKLGGEELPAASSNVGLRRVELRREKDDEGESFIICINGEPVFCKGANWAPADSFIPRLTAQDYEDLLQKAADANMNMLRVCGVGIYESDDFFDACDRLGIMVWQDFMFAC